MQSCGGAQGGAVEHRAISGAQIGHNVRPTLVRNLQVAAGNTLTIHTNISHTAAPNNYRERGQLNGLPINLKMRYQRLRGRSGRSLRRLLRRGGLRLGDARRQRPCTRRAHRAGLVGRH